MYSKNRALFFRTASPNRIIHSMPDSFIGWTIFAMALNHGVSQGSFGFEPSCSGWSALSNILRAFDVEECIAFSVGVPSQSKVLLRLLIQRRQWWFSRTREVLALLSFYYCAWLDPDLWLLLWVKFLLISMFLRGGSLENLWLRVKIFRLILEGLLGLLGLEFIIILKTCLVLILIFSFLYGNFRPKKSVFLLLAAWPVPLKYSTESTLLLFLNMWIFWSF